MANEQFAFLKSSSVPTRDQWQQAIDRAGFDLKLDPKFEPRTNVGVVPCKLNGAESGVEMYFDDSTEFMKAFGTIASNRDCWTCPVFYPPSVDPLADQADPKRPHGHRAVRGCLQLYFTRHAPRRSARARTR